MAIQEITLTVTPRGRAIRKLPSEITIPRAAPVSEIYQKIAATTGMSIHRIRVTKGSDFQHVPNDFRLPVLDTGLRDGSRIAVKDLGTPCPNLRLFNAYCVQVHKSHGGPSS